MVESKCKICRRFGVKLFLKGERCLSPKCAMVKRNYPPGIKRKRIKRSFSEYGIQLREKQKMKKWYNLREKEFKNYIKKILQKRGKVENASDLLIRELESRLDNVVFRLGFAISRPQARQLISHGYFLVNGRSINISSFQVKKGDVISLKPLKTKKAIIQSIKNYIKKSTPPEWLQLNPEKLEGKVVGEPSLAESSPPAEISTILEFYSR